MTPKRSVRSYNGLTSGLEASSRTTMMRIMQREPSRQTCTAHCTTCNLHFHGVTAFDLHRQKFECVEPQERVSPKGNPLLQVWTEEGSCDLSDGCWENGKRVRFEEPITIWQQVPLGLKSEAVNEV